MARGISSLFICSRDLERGSRRDLYARKAAGEKVGRVICLSLAEIRISIKHINEKSDFSQEEING